MSLHSLNHLELYPYTFGLMQFRVPIVLPTIQYLHLDATLDPAYLGIIIHSFQAESLITLSLDGWDLSGEDDALEDALELYFPTLEHLILLNVTRGYPDRDLFAQRFPNIKRLTCQCMSPWEMDHVAGDMSCDVIDIMTPICFGTQFDAGTESSPINDWERWPKLQVLAVSCTDVAMDIEGLYSMISMLKDMVHGIRKLLLPKYVCERANKDAMRKLRELVEVEDYSLDWPTPFAQSS
ncbi:hypothetical protein FIBSPDRAFT_995297 [Athelia psychrophila]|uniref:F-box domain-containing protein n=1 Tax=Athelia psychrophila TaxID=1759441 RepID=A0A166RNQ6_9AGAM|nr:hypothetical protein FIBSPDRAFT_995297 [Fibularhizoctonia sp. CBS 109695]